MQSRQSFQDSKAYSFSADDLFYSAYYSFFPTLVRIETNTSLPLQRQGVDRILHLNDGTKLRVEEKLRRRDWNDLLLEYVSNNHSNSPGWIEKDLRIDYLVYAVEATQTIRLYEWKPLRKAWLTHKAEWLKTYPIIKGWNRTYTSFSVAVPYRIVRQALKSGQAISES